MLGTKLNVLCRGLLVTFASFSVSLPLHAATNEEACFDLSSKMNKYYPRRADKITTTTGSFCVPNPTRSTLVFNHRLDILKSEIPSGMLMKWQAMQLQILCTDPEQLELLKMFNVRHTYYDKDNEYVGRTAQNIVDCP